MNIAFCISRMNYIGHFGPLVKCFREKGARIILLCDHRQVLKDHGYKAYMYPDLDEVRKAFENVEVRAFSTTEEFVDIILTSQIQAVFFLSLESIAKEAKTIIDKKQVHVIFAQLQTGTDVMHSKELSPGDIVYLFSESWKEIWKKWLLCSGMVSGQDQEHVFKQIDDKSIISGFPQVDAFKDFDRQAICEKHDLPKDKKIVLLLPFPWRVPFSVWSHIIYKPQNKLLKLARLFLHFAWQDRSQVFNAVDDLQVTRAIRMFADRNNAFFLVKGRKKNKVPAYIKRIADKVIFDESYYPYTINEVLFVSDICINFYSDVIKESVISNTPSICLGPEKREDWCCFARRFSMDEFSLKQGSCYNFEGVVFNESVNSFVKTFPKKTFEDYRIHSENRKKYIEKFLGFDDLRSSERIYEDLCHRLGSFGNTQLS